MNKRKGFTLIELLAVIVILAIIAIIAVPQILGVIEKARKGAAESSALGYIDAVEKQIALAEVDSSVNSIVDKKYTVSELTTLEVKVKGSMPEEDGTVTVEKGRVTDYSLTFGKYTITPKDTKSNSSTKETATACKATKGNGTNIGDEITCGSESFYVYNTDGDNIKMLSKYNLEVGNSDNSSYPATTETYLQSEKAIGYQKDLSDFYATVAFSSDSQKGTNYSDYTGSIVEGYANKYKEKLTALGVKVSEARLITKEELETLGCDSSNSYTCSSAPSFVYSTSYWSDSPNFAHGVWLVYGDGSFTDDYFSFVNDFGVRPVVVISKSSI